MTTDPGPMTPGTAVALAHLQTVRLLQGQPLNVLGALAYGFDRDARHWLNERRATDDAERERWATIRRFFQESTRFNAACAGLLGFDRVMLFPVDAEGRDVQLTELLAVPWAEITAAAETNQEGQA